MMAEIAWKPGLQLEDRYEILEILGAGGMGTVFKARDLDLNRSVAIKRFDGVKDYSEGSDDYIRFCREGHSLSRLSHPNIVSIYSMGLFMNAVPYIVMEYVEGKSLKKIVQDGGPVAWPRALQICYQIAEGLAAAHAEGIIHRDVKPENILVSFDEMCWEEHARLVDFGLCKLEHTDVETLTKAGSLIGSIHYMAPEIMQGKKVTAAIDVYSLACTLYESLSGRPPFDADTATGIIYKHCNDSAAKLETIFANYPWPDSLDSLLSSALEKDPEKRIAPQEFALGIDKVLAHAPDKVTAPQAITESPNPSIPSRNSGFLSKRTCIWLGCSALILTLGLLSLPWILNSEPITEFMLLNYQDLLPETKVVNALNTYLNELQTSKNEKDFQVLCDHFLRKPPQKCDSFALSRCYLSLAKAARDMDNASYAKKCSIQSLAEEARCLARLYAQPKSSNRALVSELLVDAGINADYLMGQHKVLTSADWKQIFTSCHNIPIRTFDPYLFIGSASEEELKSIRSILLLHETAFWQNKSRDMRDYRIITGNLAIATHKAGMRFESYRISEEAIHKLAEHGLTTWALDDLVHLGFKYQDDKKLERVKELIDGILIGKWQEIDFRRQTLKSRFYALYSKFQLGKKNYAQVVRMVLPKYAIMIPEHLGATQYELEDSIEISANLDWSMRKLGLEREAEQVLEVFKTWLASSDVQSLASSLQSPVHKKVLEAKSVDELQQRLDNIPRLEGTVNGDEENKHGSESSFSPSELQLLWSKFKEQAAGIRKN